MATPLSDSLKLWAGSELRRRWAGLILLGALGGLAAGLTIAAVDGARRSATSYERMRAEHLAADAIFFPSQVAAYDVDVSKLGELPEVTAWGGFALMDARLDGFAPGDSPFFLVGSDWLTRIEGAKVLEGRLPDPTRDDEAVITVPGLIEEQLGVHVGSVLTSRTLSKEQQEAFGFEAPADFDWVNDAEGPVTEFHIVGAVRLPMESVVPFAATGLLLPSPGWMEQHGDQVQVYFTNALVRLRNGAADIPALQSDVARIYGRADLPVKDLSTDVKRINRSVNLERTALLLFAAAVALAGAVIVGQSLTRSLRAGAESVPALAAMGMGPTALAAGLVVPHLLAVGVMLVIAAATAAVLSARFPVGLARQLDPDLGIRVDWRVLSLGLAVTLLIALLSTVLLSFAVVRSHRRRTRLARTRALGAATKAGLPVTTGIGLSLALERGPTRTSPVRPALVAGVIGIIGIVGGMTLVKGIDEAVADPATTGAVWNVEAETSEELDAATAIAQLNADPSVSDFAVERRVATLVGDVEAPLYSLSEEKGSLHFVVMEGHEPRHDDEIALGPATSSNLHVGIGDTITVGLNRRPVTVVGISLLRTTPHSSYDEGAWVTDTVMNDVAGPQTGSEAAYTGLIRLADGVDADVWTATLSPDWFTVVPSPAPDVVNLERVRSLPLYLAGFLCILALGAAAHALLSGNRRRAGELAVLRSFGLTPRQTAACVGWQAATIGIVALAIGVPIGILIGRQLWRLIADSLSAVYSAPLSSSALLLVVPAVLLVLVVLAIWPARAAARMHTAQVLRSE